MDFLTSSKQRIVDKYRRIIKTKQSIIENNLRAVELFLNAGTGKIPIRNKLQQNALLRKEIKEYELKIDKIYNKWAILA